MPTDSVLERKWSRLDQLVEEEMKRRTTWAIQFSQFGGVSIAYDDTLGAIRAGIRAESFIPSLEIENNTWNVTVAILIISSVMKLSGLILGSQS